jgi:hypothetical protein
MLCLLAVAASADRSAVNLSWGFLALHSFLGACMIPSLQLHHHHQHGLKFSCLNTNVVYRSKKKTTTK